MHGIPKPFNIPDRKGNSVSLGRAIISSLGNIAKTWLVEDVGGTLKAIFRVIGRVLAVIVIGLALYMFVSIIGWIF